MNTTVGDVMRVYFTHQITTAIAAGANARTYFTAPEIATTGTAPVINGFVANNRIHRHHLQQRHRPGQDPRGHHLAPPDRCRRVERSP